MTRAAGSRIGVVLVGATVAAVAMCTAQAHAAFPGTNGRIAFAWDAGSNLTSLYSIDSDGTGQTRLTTSSSNDRDPVWSPDGRRTGLGAVR
jgi:dipeptidyl aminopeptidase/acylaminoacyl peptidase